MMINKKSNMYFGSVTTLSILVLSFHMPPLKFIYNYIGLMLSADGLTGEKRKVIVVQAENLKNFPIFYECISIS